MLPMIDHGLSIAPTPRFAVWEARKAGVRHIESVLHEVQVDVMDVLWHKQRSKTQALRNRLVRILHTHGFFCLTSELNESPVHRVVIELRESLHRDIYPAVQRENGSYKHDTESGSDSSNRTKINGEASSNVKVTQSGDNMNSANGKSKSTIIKTATSNSLPVHTHLKQSSHLYVSEKNLPMYYLGYELAEDGMRESFRISASQPDHVDYPSLEARRAWLKGLGLCRQLTDNLLDILSEKKGCGRPSQGIQWWKSDANLPDELADREGDFSVFYAMHYFNKDCLQLDGVNNSQDSNQSSHSDKLVLKAHVDPSLLVIEPFVSTENRGLQVWDAACKAWLDVDGRDLGFCMPVMVGQAVGLPATLHRVVQGGKPRSTVLYEQKYAEYYPTPEY
jgi:hypothetical protein